MTTTTYNIGDVLRQLLDKTVPTQIAIVVECYERSEISDRWSENKPNYYSLYWISTQKITRAWTAQELSRRFVRLGT